MSRLMIHPGEHIADEIEAQDLSASERARILHIPANRLTEIIRGRRGISADTALRLAWWLGTTPEYWMNFQRNYELRLAEAAHGDDSPRDHTLAEANRLNLRSLRRTVRARCRARSGRRC